MAEYTQNYNLYKPNRVDTDPVDTTLTANFQTIDDEMKKRETDIATVTNDLTTKTTDLQGQIDSKTFTLQEQVDSLVINGDSSVEAAQARVNAVGVTFDTLRDRLNDSDTQLNEKVNKNDQKVFDITTTPASYYSTLALPLAKIMQGFYFSQNGKHLFANWADGGTPESFVLYRMTPTGKLLDSMTLTGFGHGTVLAIEDIGADTYIWSCIDGTTNLARFKYVAGATYTTTSPEVSTFSNFGVGEVVNPSIDGDYIYFCRNLGSGNSWKVEKRNLSDVKAGTNVILSEITIPVSHLYLQGYCVDGDTLYWLTGDTNGVTYPIKLTTFDLKTGSIVNDLPIDFGESTKGVAEGSYKEPEGVFLYKDSTGANSLFVGMVTGDDITRYNKVFAYHSVLNANKFLGLKLQDVPSDNNPSWIGAIYKNGAVTNWSYPLQYRKITGGKVQLRGCVGGFTSGSAVATLPYEYKPRKMQRRIAAGDGSTNPSRVSIDNSTGDITVSLGTSVTAVWLDMEFDINN